VEKKMWNKRGEGAGIWGHLVEMLLAAVIVIVLVLVLAPRIKDWGKNTDSYRECSVFNKKGGCFNEADRLTKEDDGYLCFNNTGGCKSDISWCCYGVVA